MKVLIAKSSSILYSTVLLNSQAEVTPIGNINERQEVQSFSAITNSLSAKRPNYWRGFLIKLWIQSLLLTGISVFLTTKQQQQKQTEQVERTEGQQCRIVSLTWTMLFSNALLNTSGSSSLQHQLLDLVRQCLKKGLLKGQPRRRSTSAENHHPFK